MRGEICIGSATFLSLTALLLLIFAHVGQINTSSVPRGVYLAKLNVSQLGASLELATSDPVDGLYATNASAPLLQGRGLRQFYEFGLYSHCGYLQVNETSSVSGICSNHSAAYQYEPYKMMSEDMTSNYVLLTDALVTDTTFSNSGFLGKNTKGAYYTILLGTICCFLAFVTGVTKRNITFVISTVMAVLATILILCGAAIWTVMIHKSSDINGKIVISGSKSVPIGIHVSVGPALYLLWAAFACSFASLVPYLISCCTYRG